MPLRPCLGCHQLTANGTRCTVCTPTVQRGKRQRRPHANAEDIRRAQVVEAWRHARGAWCPGWGVPPHMSDDLTADHVIPYAVTKREDSELACLCRACNGRKGASLEPA